MVESKLCRTTTAVLQELREVSAMTTCSRSSRYVDDPSGVIVAELDLEQSYSANIEGCREMLSQSLNAPGGSVGSLWCPVWDMAGRMVEAMAVESCCVL